MGHVERDACMPNNPVTPTHTETDPESQALTATGATEPLPLTLPETAIHSQDPHTLSFWEPARFSFVSAM